MNKFPEKDTNDYCLSAGKAVINLVPHIGGALAVLLESVFSEPIDNRKKKWFEELAKSVNVLSEKIDGISAESLSKDPSFISLSLEATNIALRTHSNKKLKSLNNIIKNSIIIKDVNESKKMIFLRIIGEMTPLHIDLFNFLLSPEEYIKKHSKKLIFNLNDFGTSLQAIWSKIQVGENVDHNFNNLIVNDLKAYGLVYINDFKNTTDTHMKVSCATDLGREFNRFISNSEI